MQKIVIVYSPLCEANGAFIGQIYEWLEDSGVEIEVCSYDAAAERYKELIDCSGENCFMEVFYEEKLIDSIPLHRERLLSALDIIDTRSNHVDKNPSLMLNSTLRVMSDEEFRNDTNSGKVEFIPITKDTYLDEMSMCLNNYPRGNPSLKYHKDCICIKEKIYVEVFQQITAAGVYAKWNGSVIGLLEVFPREIVRKYGYMSGTSGDDAEVLTVSCYEVGYGIPRILMLDELMRQLLANRILLSRKYIEGIGVFEWNDGFNPYWVYEKYGFHKTEQKNPNTVVMRK